MTQSTPTKIRFKKTWFNPVYYHILKYSKDPTIRRILIYGSKSSAKTLSICQFLERSALIENCSSIAYRKEQSTIKTTLKQSFKKSVDLLKLGQGFSIMDFSLISSNGQVIVLKGLDEEGKIKGIEGYKYLLFDELNHFLEEEWSQANISLRGMPGQKLFATWNPVNERSWIKKDIDNIEWKDLPRQLEGGAITKLDDSSYAKISSDGKTILIKTTYLDNKWIVGGDGYGFRDENLIWEYDLLRRSNPNSYRVNVLGEWGKPEVQRPYVYNFEDRHIGKVEKLPNVQIRTSLDFNLEPFVATHWQMYLKNGEFYCHCFDETVIKLGGVLDMCQQLESKFTKSEIANMLFTGDATARKRNMQTANNIGAWGEIDHYFKLGKRLQVPQANPSVQENRHLVNSIFALLPNLLINENCKLLISELQFTEATPEGDIIKSTRKDLAQRSDGLDTLRYTFNTWMSDFSTNPNKYRIKY